MTWIESGTATAREPASKPGSKGFGHTVIVDMIASTLDANVEVRLDPDGFKWLVFARSDIGLVS